MRWPHGTQIPRPKPEPEPKPDSTPAPPEPQPEAPAEGPKPYWIRVPMGAHGDVLVSSTSANAVVWRPAGPTAYRAVPVKVLTGSLDTMIVPYCDVTKDPWMQTVELKRGEGFVTPTGEIVVFL